MKRYDEERNGKSPTDVPATGKIYRDLFRKLSQYNKKHYGIHLGIFSTRCTHEVRLEVIFGTMILSLSYEQRGQEVALLCYVPSMEWAQEHMRGEALSRARII